MGKHDKWTAQEIQILRKLYSDTLNNELSGILGRSPGAIYKKAQSLQLKKNRQKVHYGGPDPLKFIIKQQQQAGYLQ